MLDLFCQREKVMHDKDCNIFNVHYKCIKIAKFSKNTHIINTRRTDGLRWLAEKRVMQRVNK